MMEIDPKLLAILNSKCNSIGYASNLKYLVDSNVLTNKEKELCNNLLFQVAALNNVDLKKVLRQLNLNIDELENMEEFSFSKMYEEIDKLITSRYEKENQLIISESIKEQTEGIYNDKTLSLFLRRYANKITLEEDTIFEDLYYNPKSKFKEKGISTANELIDIVSGNISNGSVTTIVGNSNDLQSLWGVNIAYKCLKEDLNVLYISLVTTKVEIYKRFLSRHSCDRKFEKPIHPNEVNNDYDESLYKKVHSDFENFFFEKLLIFDAPSFYINNIYNLQKIIAYSENKFRDRTEKGVGLIIIEGFSNMTINDGKKIITNKEMIINTYFSYLKNQAQNILGTSDKIPIIVTVNPNDKGMILLDNNCDFTLDFVDSRISLLSNNIFSIYGNSRMKKSEKVQLKVLKSEIDIMEESKVCQADYQHWHIKYSENNNDDEKSKDERIEVLENENEFLYNNSLEDGKMIENLLMNQSSTPSSNAEIIDFDELFK